MRIEPVLVHKESPWTMWELLRQMRNLCLDGLTRVRTEISYLQQQAYLETYDPNFVRHYLFMDKDRNEFIGFARIEYRDHFYWPTLGVHPDHRGRGYGREVVRQVMMMAGGPLKGEWLVSNESIQRIEKPLGWYEVGEPVDGIQPVQADWPPKFTLYMRPGRTIPVYGDPGQVVQIIPTDKVPTEMTQQEIYDEIVRYHGYGTTEEK